MDQEQARKISKTLRTLADEVKSTAIGSSRVAMYDSIAVRIIEQADQIDPPAPLVGWSDKRERDLR